MGNIVNSESCQLTIPKKKNSPKSLSIVVVASTNCTIDSTINITHETESEYSVILLLQHDNIGFE